MWLLTNDIKGWLGEKTFWDIFMQNSNIRTLKRKSCLQVTYPTQFRGLFLSKCAQNAHLFGLFSLGLNNQTFSVKWYMAWNERLSKNDIKSWPKVPLNELLSSCLDMSTLAGMLTLTDRLSNFWYGTWKRVSYFTHFWGCFT